MPDASDMELVRDFNRTGSEAAFAELVRRHINLVYSVAWRYTGQPQDAEDVTQAVFIILAKKAAGLRERTVLGGWLYETTRFTATRLLRTKARRAAREQEAGMESTLNESGSGGVWRQLAPHLEEGMSRLGERDRTLLALRFYENKSGAEAASLLGIREAAAHKRTARALEKLRKFFTKRGIVFSAAAIAGAVTANSVQAAPAGLAVTISAGALAKGAAAGGSTLTLVKGALKLMAWTKAKTAVVAGVGILLIAGTTTVAVREIRTYEDQNIQWQKPGNVNQAWLEKAPPLLKIVPTKFPDGGNGCDCNDASDFMKAINLGSSVYDLLEHAYGGRPARTVFLTELPKARYDFVVTVPSKPAKRLQAAITEQFGISGKFEIIETNVFLLEVKYPNAQGLKPATTRGNSTSNSAGRLSGTGQPISALAGLLESWSAIPTIDRTGLTNSYDFTLTWDASNLEALKQALLDQLGLELVPTNMPVEMLVVERVR